MASLERPKLRPLSMSRVEHQGQPFVSLEDSLGLFPGQVLIPLPAFTQIVRNFDGTSSLDEIRTQVQAETGQLISNADMLALVESLDRAMVLEGPTYSSFVAEYSRQQVRASSHAGRSYSADSARLQQDLNRYFESSEAANFALNPDSETGSFRGILSPHIDFGRGGPVYTHAYRHLIEQSEAEVFVILGVAHQACQNRFALTRKDFRTPLGTVPTDRAYVDRLAELAGVHLFDDELAHRSEHSIEFQVVFLQHVLGGLREFSIVPILVGSFHDLMKAGLDPIGNSEVKRMIQALQAAEAASGRQVAYIGGIDLCHVGPDFGDAKPVDDSTLKTIRSFDSEMLARASAGDAEGWFSKAAEVENRWRVCGLAATYTMLHAIGPAQGRVLCYEQAVNPSRSCCVSFASVAFHAR